MDGFEKATWPLIPFIVRLSHLCKSQAHYILAIRLVSKWDSSQSLANDTSSYLTLPLDIIKNLLYFQTLYVPTGTALLRKVNNDLREREHTMVYLMTSEMRVKNFSALNHLSLFPFLRATCTRVLRPICVWFTYQIILCLRSTYSDATADKSGC